MEGSSETEKTQVSALEGHWARERIEEIYLPAAKKVVASFGRIQADRTKGDSPDSPGLRYVWYDFDGNFSEFAGSPSERSCDRPHKAYYMMDSENPELDSEVLALKQWEDGQIPGGIVDLDAYTKRIVEGI